ARPARPDRDERARAPPPPPAAGWLAAPALPPRPRGAAPHTPPPPHRPTTARNYGVIGAALVELGRYHAAFETFDTMAAMQPGFSSYARVAHARQLLVEAPGA